MFLIDLSGQALFAYRVIIAFQPMLRIHHCEYEGEGAKKLMWRRSCEAFILREDADAENMVRTRVVNCARSSSVVGLSDLG